MSLPREERERFHCEIFHCEISLKRQKHFKEYCLQPSSAAGSVGAASSVAASPPKTARYQLAYHNGKNF